MKTILVVVAPAGFRKVSWDGRIVVVLVMKPGES